MIVFLLAAMTVIGLALGGAIPTSIGAARDGRAAAWALEAEAAARWGVEAGSAAGWTAGAPFAPIGGVVALGAATLGARTTVVSTAQRVGVEVWLLHARAEVRAGGGALLAASEIGLVGRLVQTPADTIPRFVAASRPWFRRPP